MSSKEILSSTFDKKLSKSLELKKTLENFKKEENKLSDEIPNTIKNKATEANVWEESLRKIFEKNNPDISDLIDEYKIDVNHSKKEISVIIRTDIWWQQKEYEIVLTKEWTKAKWLIDTEWNDIDDFDQEYNADDLDKTIQKIKNWLYERAGNEATKEKIVPNINKKLDATKKVFKAMFLD